MRFLRLTPGLIVAVFAIGTVGLWLLLSDSSVFLLPQRGHDLRFLGRSPKTGPGFPPVFAYWISGTDGDCKRVVRLLKAVYHPRNRYLLHLDAGATVEERKELACAVQSEKVIQAFGNVDVIGRPCAMDRTGSSIVAATLHGASILLKTRADWDWFIVLSSLDYPVVTQDDLLHVFAPLPRHLNFIDHTSDLGWKEFDRFNKIIVDQSLYMDSNTEFFAATETREMPDSFMIFIGSPWPILSRSFVEHCVQSWDNLPRKLLMYFTNVPYAMESYFQTVICNSPEFVNTTVNNDLRFFLWDDPPGLDPLFLNGTHYKKMVGSGAAFARRFAEDDPMLHEIDVSILRRKENGFAYGRWCSGSPGISNGLLGDPCTTGWGDIDEVVLGPSGKKLRNLVAGIVSSKKMRSNQCKSAVSS